MRITAHVKPKAYRASVSRRDDGAYDVAVTEAPERGRATASVRRALAVHLGIAPSRLSLIMGEASRTKVFEVMALVS